MNTKTIFTSYVSTCVLAHFTYLSLKSSILSVMYVGFCFRESRTFFLEMFHLRTLHGFILIMPTFHSKGMNYVPVPRVLSM